LTPAPLARGERPEALGPFAADADAAPATFGVDSVVAAAACNPTVATGMAVESARCAQMGTVASAVAARVAL